MGVSSSKFKKQQQQQQHYPPYPYPPYAFPPGQYPPHLPGFVPQGFVPNGYPTFQPQQQPQQAAMQMPQPQPPPPQPQPQQPPMQPSQSTRRRKRTRNYSTGHDDRAGPSFSQPQAPSRAPSRTTRDDRPRDGPPPPLFTPNNASRPLANFPSPEMGSRSASARHRQTPYSAPRQMSREDSEDSNYEHEHEHEHEHEREPLHYETPRDPEPTMRVIQPMDPAPAAVYGPPEDDDLRPIKHPLPPPPRDLYELTPYKTLFNLPQTTALLTATYGDGMNAPLGVRPQQAAPAPATAPPPERKRTRKGLFRAFSTRREQPPPPAPAPPEPNVRYVPVPMYIPVGGPLGATGGAAGEPPQTAGFQPPQQQQQQQMHPQDTGYPTPQQPQSVGFQPPPQQQQMPPQQDGYQTPQQVRSMPPEPASIIPGPPPVIPGGTPSNQYFAGGAGPNVPPQMQIHASSSTDSQIIRFDQTSQYAGFLNHSPHRVLYNNKTYPSATHLHEAMKYIENRPEIAEFIRTCPNIHDVYPLSAQYQQYQRADWGQLFMSLMEEVLFLKFRQHPDLRALLLKTGEAILRYADGKDPFWGEGPDGSGRNELGKALMKVRRKLVEANFAP